MQAELIHLETKLQRAAKADLASGDAAGVLYERDWQSLAEGGLAPGGCGDQWEVVLQVREKLKEYSECMVRSIRDSV